MRHSAAITDFRRVTDGMASSSHVQMPSEDVSELLPSCLSLLRKGLPLGQSEVSVCYDPTLFSRRTNPAQDAAIASLWRRRLRANSRLYNASKFRVAGVRQPEENGHDASPILLQLGLTCYRDHIGTNCANSAPLLQEAGLAVHGHPQSFMADCLAVGGLVFTADNRFVFIRRAGWTGEYPNRVDRPGGHAEPHHLLQQLHRVFPERYPLQEPVPEDRNGILLSVGGAKRDGSSPSTGPTQDVQNGSKVTNSEDADAAGRRSPDPMKPLHVLPADEVLGELFESIRREVRDELGIPMTHLSQPLMTGLVRDQNNGGRPTVEFIMRCSLPSAEVERIYREGKQSEADETVGILFLHRDELIGVSPVFPIPDLSEVECKPSDYDHMRDECKSSRQTSEALKTAVLVREQNGSESEGNVVQNGHICIVDSVKVLNQEKNYGGGTTKTSVNGVRPNEHTLTLLNGMNGHDEVLAGEGSSGNNYSSLIQLKDDEAPRIIDVRPRGDHDHVAADVDQNRRNAEDSADVVADQDRRIAGVEESGEVVVVQSNGTVLLQSDGPQTVYTTESLLGAVVNGPATASPASSQIETAAEVVNVLGQDEQLDKHALWKEMTPGGKGSLILLKQLKLKGLVFQF